MGHHRQYDWQGASGLLPATRANETGLQCALVPDVRDEVDHVAVVYDKGQTPPRITVESVSGSVHKVLADGIAVAVVARSNGIAPSASDVLLVERQN